jgi:hypothetical protein
VFEFGTGMLGGFFAWFATMLLGQPFYELIKLRREAAWLLHMYESAANDPRAAIGAWLAERELAYRDCAAKLRAFSASEPVATALAEALLHWSPDVAGQLMWTLAPLGPGAEERKACRAGIAHRLRLSV